MAFKDEEYRRRMSRLRAVMSRERLDGLLLSGPADVRYLCGFSGSSGMVLLLGRSGYFITDFRYREQAALEVAGLRVVICEDGFGQALREVLSRRTAKGAPGVMRIGFDPGTVTYAELLRLRRQLRGVASLVAMGAETQALRARKSRSEVEVLKKGLRVAEEAFREALGRVDKRTTEWELAMEVDFAARRRGAETTAFETIVASGSRGALVHAKPSRKGLAGAAVIDWGVVYGGYNTDCTRTLAFGRVPAELVKAHRLVMEARERALAAVRAGVRAREVDRAAREVIEKAGYGEAFGHGLGHGVGLEVHERPHVGPKSRDLLEEGMVFTVEPGIYLPGVGGVRVEDMVLVTAHGMEVLASFPHSLDPSDY
ncbi:MAG: aminopeptidase P family protein [Actinobacteria bacterium]|nr:aminopeptidase P family protein [Actinomycetota bacterium]